MRATYEDIEMLSARHAWRAHDRSEQMPLLGLLSGMVAALVLWSGIAALAWALFS